MPRRERLVSCVENRRWTLGDVTYATLNVQGSCNNLCDVAPDMDEWAARNEANIAWLQETFAEARGPALVRGDADLAGQSGLRPERPHPQSFAQPEDASANRHCPRRLPGISPGPARRVIDFVKPVAYVHGDSHYLRIDKPFLDSMGRRLENFTRVETFGNNAPNGNNDVQWLKVLVDADSREVFSYQAQIVPGNRTAVPTP